MRNWARYLLSLAIAVPISAGLLYVGAHLPHPRLPDNLLEILTGRSRTQAADTVDADCKARIDQTGASPLEYEVLRAFLAAYRPGRTESHAILVLDTIAPKEGDMNGLEEVLASTSPDPRGAAMQVDRTALDSLRARNFSSVALDAARFGDLPFAFAGVKELEPIYSRGSAAAEEALGNTWVVRVSRIGISCSQRQAVFYFDEGSGRTEGAGYWVAMQKTSGGWAEAWRFMLWMS